MRRLWFDKKGMVMEVVERSRNDLTTNPSPSERGTRIKKEMIAMTCKDQNREAPSGGGRRRGVGVTSSLAGLRAG